MSRRALAVPSVVWTLLAVPALAACASGAIIEERGSGDPRTPRDPDEPAPWMLHIDTSATSSYVPASAPTARIEGRVIASEGLASLEVDGDATPFAAGNAFTVNVPVTPGLVHVPIEARDRAMHERRGDRALLVADFLPEGRINPRAAALALSDEMLAAMAAPLDARVGAIDIATAIMSRERLTNDRCVTRPTRARHGRPALRLFVDEMGQLVLEIRIPGLRVDFAGECRLLLSRTPVTGNIETDVVLRTTLFATPGDDCVTGLEHGPADVTLENFDIDVSGGGSLLSRLLISLVAELREGAAAEQMETEFERQANELLSSELSMLRVFDQTGRRTFFDVELDLGMCLTGLESEGGVLRALVGARVSGPGLAMAPGAPMVPGDLPAARASTLTLDANLIAQLVFSAWRAGALSRRGVMDVDVGTLALFAPRLRTLYDTSQRVTIDIDGELPPMVRAARVEGEITGGGDIVLDIGQLDLVMRVGDEVLFRIGNVLRITVELSAEAGALRPRVLDVQATSWVEDEPVVDARDEPLARIIQERIGASAAGLIGGSAIELPDLGGVPLTPTDVTPDPGGRYVHVGL
jgi:hypothetical protein